MQHAKKLRAFNQQRILDNMKAKGGWMNMGYTNKKINEIHSFPCKYSKLRAKNQQRVCVCKSNIMDDMWRGGCA